MKITIGFAFYGQKYYSEKFLNSILRSDLDGVDFEIVLVGNNCPEKSEEFIKKNYRDKFKNLKIIENSENRGCSGGWNDIVRNSCGEYIFICNNDVVFHPSCIKNIVNFMNTEKNIKIVSPCILERNNTEQDLQDHVVEKKMEKFYKENSGNLITTWSIIAGCIRREVFSNDLVGEFDENFKIAFYEDFDFGNRTKMKGIYGASIGDAVCHHFGSKTVRQVKYKMKENYEYFSKKYENGFQGIKSIESFSKPYGSIDDDVWKYAPIVNLDKILIQEK